MNGPKNVNREWSAVAHLTMHALTDKRRYWLGVTWAKDGHWYVKEAGPGFVVVSNSVE